MKRVLDESFVRLLEAEIDLNEAKVIYHMLKAQGQLKDISEQFPSYRKGTCVVKIRGNTCTVSYSDGSKEEYTEVSETPTEGLSQVV
jgi:2-phospho-L-lactate guanylyltransferase (CobY/MobA/RfbA family)